MKTENLTKEFVSKYIRPFLVHDTKRLYIDTKRFSPVIYEDDRPLEGDLYYYKPDEVPYKSESERGKFIEENNIITDSAWWAKQHTRCLEGYIVKNATNLGEDIWIPGRMYFFLNFWPIKLATKAGRKKLGNPRFVDMGFEKFFLIREYSVFMRKNNMWMKRRQVGFSEMGACDMAYEFTFFEDSQSVVVSGEEKYTFNFMNFVTRGLMHLSNTQFHIQTSTYRPKDYIKAKYVGSEIYGRTALNNAEAVSSLSPSLIYFEEIGIWQRGLLQVAYGHVKVSLEAESDEHGIRKRTGFAYMIGTGGNMEKGVGTVQKIFYAPKGNGLLSFKNRYETLGTSDAVACFVPAIYFNVVDVDGNSITEKSRENILEARENMTPAALYSDLTQMPLTPAECFMVNTAGFFGPKIIQLLNARKSWILGNASKVFHQKGYLEWKRPGDWFAGVEFVESDDPALQWCHIFEHPRVNVEGKVINNLYKGGTDSYDQTEAHTSTSLGSAQIFKGFNNIDDTYDKYVARITERPSEAEGGVSRFFEWVLMLTIYYNAINLIEYSKFLIIHFFVDHGFEFLLKERPEFFLASYVDNSKSANRYGIDASTKPVWLTKLRDYLTVDNIAKMDDVTQIEALSLFRYNPGLGKYNCDITISSSLCQVINYDDRHIEADGETEDSDSPQWGIAYTMSNGVMKQIMV